MCSALFDACLPHADERSDQCLWAGVGQSQGRNRETRRGRSVGVTLWHSSAARPRRYAMCMVLRQVQRVA